MSAAQLRPPTLANHLRATWGAYLLLLLGASLMVGPFAWMVSTCPALTRNRP